MCFFITFHTRTLGFVHNGLLLLTPMPSSRADALFFPIQALFAFTHRYRNLDSVHERKQACFPHYPRLFPSYPFLLSLFHLSISISILWVKKKHEILLFLHMYHFSLCMFICFDLFWDIPWLSWHSFYSWAWPWTDQDLPTSASSMLGLKECHYTQISSLHIHF